jgi:hypothetical protein
MKLFFLSTITIVLLISCADQSVVKPVWVNRSDTLVVPGLKLEFETMQTEWQATLITGIQPIKLKTRNINDKLILSLPFKNGIIEGSAEICLTSGVESFYYPVYLRNENTGNLTGKDYRSPKTVNTDSSMNQQKIVFSIDRYRNLVFSDEYSGYFSEEEITLPTVAGIYRADTNSALSSYYVQPGSCTNVSLLSVYKKEKKSYYVKAGPLKDKYNNYVSDGTLVTFIYSNEEKTGKMEAITKDGTAIVMIPAFNNEKYSMKAIVNGVVSSIVNSMPE